jgi:hypothetical protein
MLKRKSPSHTAKRETAEVDFGVGLVHSQYYADFMC